jgi:hypothetical protein
LFIIIEIKTSFIVAYMYRTVGHLWRRLSRASGATMKIARLQSTGTRRTHFLNTFMVRNTRLQSTGTRRTHFLNTFLVRNTRL